MQLSICVTRTNVPDIAKMDQSTACVARWEADASLILPDSMELSGSGVLQEHGHLNSAAAPRAAA